MYKFWDWIIRPLLNAVNPNRICEIGSDYGHNTRKILEYCLESGAFLEIIDPNPKYNPSEFLASFKGSCILHQDLSLNALKSMTACDIYLIDGDHNWYTVINELKLINSKAAKKNLPVLVLHDTGWPYGRRDLYYNPDQIPADYRRPFKKLGLRYGQNQLCEKGGINAHLNNAISDDGNQNGVMTAVEDFISESKNRYVQFHLEFWNGLTLLIPDGRISKNERLDKYLEFIRSSNFQKEMIQALESDRIALLCQIAEHKLEYELHLKKKKEITDLYQLHKRLLDQSEFEKKSLLEQFEKSKIQLKSSSDEIELLQNRIHEIESELSALESQSKAFRQFLASYEESQSVVTTQLEDMRADFDSLRAEWKGLSLSLARSEEESACLREHIQDLESERSNLESQLKAFQHFLTSYEEDRCIVSKRHERIEAELISLGAEWKGLAQALSKSEEESIRLRERIKALESERSEFELQSKELEKFFTINEENRINTSIQLKELKNDIIAICDEWKGFTHSLVSSEEERVHLCELLSEAEVENSELAAQVLALRDSFAASEKDRSIITGKLAEYEAAKTKAPQLTATSVSMMDVLAPALRRSVRVDIIVPVFNAIEDVKACLDSLQRNVDDFDQRIIIINDGSDAATTEWLRNWSGNRESVELIEHEGNLGYTRSVNTGLRRSTAPYVILLNSDTIVTKDWIYGLIQCAISDSKIGIVGPLSNAATWQSVPDVFDAEGFAINQLPSGLYVEDMARIVREESSRIYPRLPFVNGFCYLMKRQVIDSIGLMDEESFPVGYGEENDYCIRASDAGFTLAIADDTYVFHAKSKSFGHEQRKEFSKRGSNALRHKHGDEKVKNLINEVKETKLLSVVRQKINARLQSLTSNPVMVNPIAMKILFLLPVKGGSGGAHSVVQETAAMRRLGIEARIAVKSKDLEHLHRLYHDISSAKDLFVGFDNHNLIDIASDYDVVVATIFNSVELLAAIIEACPHIMPAYYVQDYEPLFFESATELWEQAHASYTRLPECVLFAKTHWIARKIEREHGVLVHKVVPSIDHDTYSPVMRKKDGYVRITAMIRPKTPRRGAERTMRVLGHIEKRYREKVRVHLFGCEETDPLFQVLHRDFNFKMYGILSRSEVAALLRQSDIFLDLSDYQAFGRTGLEAMACGCAAMVPMHGGTDEYAIDGKNTVVVDSLDEERCVERLSFLIENPAFLSQLQCEGVSTAADYSVHRAAVSELKILSKKFAAYRSRHPRIEKQKLILLPARKNIGVAANSGYVRVVQPWMYTGIKRAFQVILSSDNRLPTPDEADIALIQKDAGGLDVVELRKWLLTWRHAGRKLVFEVDDELLDIEGLQRLNHCGYDLEASDAIRFLAQAADVVIVSTPVLADSFRKLNQKVYLIPSYLDSDLWRIGLPRLTGKEVFVKQPGDPVRIGYIGTPTHDQDLAIVTEAIRCIETEYGDRVSVEVIGAFQKTEPFFGKRIGLPKNNDYPNFVNWLHKRVNWDIGIIPLTDDRFNRSKSHLKFLEYSALRLASICSDVPSYRDVVRNGENGLLISNTTEAWYGAIKSLIENVELRDRLAAQAYEDVGKFYTIKANTSLYTDVLANVLGLPELDELPEIPASLKRSAVISDPQNIESINENSSSKPSSAASPDYALLNVQPRSEQPLFQRRLKKLRRDPYRFFADSRYSMLRSVSSFFKE